MPSLVDGELGGGIQEGEMSGGGLVGKMVGLTVTERDMKISYFDHYGGSRIESRHQWIAREVSCV